MNREEGLQEELAFWARVLQDDYVRDSLDPDKELQSNLSSLLGDPRPVRILDVGAGPLTLVGRKWRAHDVHIVAVDPLADEYAKLLERYKLRGPVPTRMCAGERLAEFICEPFDLTYARNSLDHAEDPVKCVRNMILLTKPGGYAYLAHVAREGQHQKYEGLHKWNFSGDVNSVDFFVWGQAEAVTNVTMGVSDLIDSAFVEEKDGWVTAVFRRAA